MLRRLTALAVTAILVLALAACGDGGTDTDDEGADVTTDDATDTDADTDTDTGDDMAAGGDVGVASTDLGEALVDADGMTLYLFDADEQGEPTCVDDCAANWPPLIVDGDPVAGEGVDAALLGTTERPDGSTQVTYDGWPLYNWAADEAPGDTTGQGVGDRWWVVAPDGTPIRDMADGEETSLGY